MEAVAIAFDIEIGDLIGPRKHKRSVVLARHVAMFVARRCTMCSYPEIGRAFNRDHTTVMHSVRKVEAELARDEQLRAVVNRLIGESAT